MRARIAECEAALAARDENVRLHAETEERLRFVLAGSGLGTWDWNIQSGEIHIDERWADMLGYTLDELDFTLDSWERLIHPDDIEQVMTDLQAHLDGTVPFYANTHRLLTKHGEYKWVQDRGKVFAWTNSGEPLRAAGTHRDVHQEKLLERQLADLALKDPLTGLPNRRHLRSVFPQAAAHAERSRKPLGLVFIDLDGFKSINDRHGHKAGDRVLTKTAERLARAARGGDVVARLGGDEFCVLLTHVERESELIQAGRRLAGTVAEPIDLDHDRVSLGCSVGISFFPQNGTSLEALIDSADAAMYAVKNSGKGDVRLAG